MTFLEEDSRTYVQSLNQFTQPFNILQQLHSLPSEGINNKINEGFLLNKNQVFETCNKGFNKSYIDGKEENLSKNYSKKSHYISTSLNALQENYCIDNNQMNCIIPPYYNVPINEFYSSSNASQSLIETDATKLPFNISNLSELFESNDKEKHTPQNVQELIYMLQMGGSRCKMEATISIRFLATSHHLFQSIFIELGGIGPLVNLLKYTAEESHWPTELRAKATIIVRAEAALALASLSVNNDYNKDTIGATGAIPLLCKLIQFNDSNCNPIITFNYNSQEMAPFFILARDAGVGALSCLSKSEKNKQEIITSQAIPVLIQMVDEGTSFGRIVAANVIAKLATGQNASENRLILGQEAGVIAPLLRLLKNGSSKAKEIAAEALENLALHDWNKTKILQERGLECLMQLLENGTLNEKKVANAAIKNLKTYMSSPIIQSNEKLDSNNNCIHSVEGSIEPSININKYVENMDIDDICKSMDHKSGTFIQKREALVDLAFSTTRDELQNLNMHVGENLQTSKDFNMWKKKFLDNDLALPKIQNISTSGLTSSIAPPLVGQPSMQVDAIIENAKNPMHSNLPTSKRMKMTICDTNNKSSNVLLQKNNLLSELHVQKINQPTIDSMKLKYLDVNKKNMDQFLRNKKNEILDQKNSFFPSTDGYEATNTMKDQQTKQCLVVDKQLVAGGIVALVNALSSSNPSAQEFATLALMLLASQGGFKVKTAIFDAGAIPLLLAMVDSSPYPIIRESAAATIAKLVSYHHINRSHVLKAGGIKSMVNMAQWSTTLIEDASSVENLKARIQAGAIVAVLSIGNIQDRQNTGMGLQDALPILIQMLESDDFNEIEASVGGIHALNTYFESREQNHEREYLTCREQGSTQITFNGTIAIEMVTVLLYLSKSSSRSTKAAALEVLIGFKQKLGVNMLKAFEPRSELFQEDSSKASQSNDCARLSGVQALLTMLTKCPTFARESVTAAFACAMASDKLSIYIVDEGPIIQQLMIILEEGPTIATKVSTAASLATIGAHKKKLNVLSHEHISLLLQLLTSNDHNISHWKESLVHSPNSRDKFLEELMPSILLCEHITAIIVYIALSGDFEKQLLTSAGAAPILVGVLKGCLSNKYNSTFQESWKYMQSMSKYRGVESSVPSYLHATQEFAIMGLIMLADKNIETMEKIVESGGISLLVKMLTAIVECKGKLSANWSEMAVAALLTLAGSNNAQDEIVRVGGISSLVQVLQSEGGAFQFSLTGLAAMAQLLGVLGLNSEETKLRMAEEGAVKCLVDILIGGGNYCKKSFIQSKIEDDLKCVALVQEAASASLATIILHCKTNAKVAVEAGAIGHLVKLLDPIIPNCDKMRNLKSQDLLPSTYKSMRNEISFPIGITSTSNSNFKLDSECNGSKRNTTTLDKNLVEVGSLAGMSLAAMAALGNIVSCYPQCWREIVDVGVAPRLASLLKGGLQMNSGEHNNKIFELEDDNIPPTNIQESAALILDLLIDCERNNCSLR